MKKSMHIVCIVFSGSISTEDFESNFIIELIATQKQNIIFALKIDT